MIMTPHFSFAHSLTHGLVGPNGCGKTTLLRQIAGQILAPDIRVDGDLPFDNQDVLDRVVLMGIDNPLPEGWNVKKIFAVGKTRWPQWNQDRADELVTKFALPQGNYSGLSRGQKSAVGFIFAVASGATIMLLDEPYLGLDPQRREVFYEVLREEHGRTIIVSVHHLNEVAGLLDTVSLLDSTPITGPVDDFVESIVELSGPAEKLDRALGRLQVPVLSRESTQLGDRAVVDARPNLADSVFDQAVQLGLRAQEVTLEKAILALGDKE